MRRRRLRSLKRLRLWRLDGAGEGVSLTTHGPPCRPLLSFAEFLEVDGPLLDECVPAFHRLVRLVVEPERGTRELRHARARLGVDVERLLGERQRRGALLEELSAPLLHLGAQIL